MREVLTYFLCLDNTDWSSQDGLRSNYTVWWRAEEEQDQESVEFGLCSCSVCVVQHLEGIFGVRSRYA